MLALFTVLIIGVAIVPAFAEITEWGYSLIHDDVTYELRPSYPVVGEIAQLTLTVTHNEFRGYTTTYDDNNNPIHTSVPYGTQHLNPVRLSIADPNNPHYRLYDITSNIGSDDPTVFTPYDHTTETTIAEPGKTYTVKAKVEILREGFVDFGAISLDGDKLGIRLAIGDEKTLPTSYYYENNKNYLSHLSGPTGQQDNRNNDFSVIEKSQLLYSSHKTPVVYLPNLSEEQIQDNVTNFYKTLKTIYDAYGANDTQIIADLDDFSSQEIKTFFRDYKGYDDDDITSLSLPPTTALVESEDSIFTIFGTVQAKDYHNDDKYIPIGGIEVCAFDHKLNDDDYTKLNNTSGNYACTFTSQIAGVFKIKDIVNDDPHTPTIADLSVGVLSFGEYGLSVIYSESNPYLKFSTPISNFNGTEFVYDFKLDGPEAGAARIVNSINDGQVYFNNHNVVPQNLDVKWHYGSLPDGVDPDSGILVYSHYNYSTNEITLNGLDEFNDDDSDVRYNILYHFGHHIIDITNATSDNCIKNSSEITPLYMKFNDVNCAFYDGLAAFIPHLVDDSSILQSELNGLAVDLETEQILISKNGTVQHKPIPRTETKDDQLINIGQIVPLQIAATLWDIKDTPNSVNQDSSANYTDDLDISDEKIIEHLVDGNFTNFEKFYDAWEKTNHGSSISIMNLHGMNFPPTYIPPVVPPSFTFDVNSGASVLVTLTAFDENNDFLTFNINDDEITQGSIGEISRKRDNASFVYTSNFDASDKDIFTFTVDDMPRNGDDPATSIISTVTINIKPEEPINAINDAFDNFDNWIPSIKDMWTIDSSQESGDVYGHEKVATSNNCDDPCVLLLNKVLNSTLPLEISFQKYIDLTTIDDVAKGLYLEYTIDNENWYQLANYTVSNYEDTNRWDNKTETLILLEDDMVNIRFVTLSDEIDEFIEIDNVIIRQIEPAIPVKFNATQSNSIPNIEPDMITLNFDRKLDVPLTVNDFAISNVTITNVNTVDDPQIILNVTDIRYNTDVTVKYVGETIQFPDNYSLVNGEESTAVGIPPDTVQNLNVTFTHNTAFVTWDDDFDSYEVRVTASGFQALGLSHDNSHDFDGLTPDTDYTITVAPDGDESKKAGTQIRTLPPYTPTTIKNLEATKTKDSFDITWDDNGASSYTVRVIEPGHFDERVEFTTNDNFATVEDLKPYTQYKIIVAPENDFDYKQLITKTTKLAPVLEGLDVAVDGNTLVISWDVQDDVDEYVVRVIEHQQHTGYDERLEFTTTNSTAMVEDLKLSTEYRIVVLPDGHEQPKAARHITTPASIPDPPPVTTPDTVQNLDVTFTHNTISITWDAYPNTSMYTVHIFEPGWFDEKIEHTTSDRSYTRDNLRPSTEYKIVVFSDVGEHTKSRMTITTESEW